MEFYNNFEGLNDEILYFSILKSSLIQTSNNNDHDYFTDRNYHDEDNTTMSNNDPAVKVLHKLEPSANEHHTTKKIAEYSRASTPKGSSMENSFSNIGYESTFLFSYFILP